MLILDCIGFWFEAEASYFPSEGISVLPFGYLILPERSLNQWGPTDLRDSLVRRWGWKFSFYRCRVPWHPLSFTRRELPRPARTLPSPHASGLKKLSKTVPTFQFGILKQNEFSVCKFDFYTRGCATSWIQFMRRISQFCFLRILGLQFWRITDRGRYKWRQCC